VSEQGIAGFLAGERASVEEIRAAIAVVVHAFHPGHDAEPDLVQEALARLVACLKEGRFRREASLKTYAQSVAKYTCLEFRRSRRVPADLDPDTMASPALWSEPETILLTKEERRQSLHAFASLPVDCRQLLLLIFIEGLTYREIGVRLGITEGGIKSRVRRIRAACRRLMSRQPRPRGETVGIGD